MFSSWGASGAKRHRLSHSRGLGAQPPAGSRGGAPVGVRGAKIFGKISQFWCNFPASRGGEKDYLSLPKTVLATKYQSAYIM